MIDYRYIIYQISRGVNALLVKSSFNVVMGDYTNVNRVLLEFIQSYYFSEYVFRD